MMWYWGGGVHWWAWLLGFMGMVVFWGLIIWVVWYLIAGFTRTPGRPENGGGPQARHILDERLARGEIDVDEYRRLRDVLTGADQTRVGNRSGETPTSNPR